jgi:transcriptional regulator with GAF, ATPase, and Fis domain
VADAEVVRVVERALQQPRSGRLQRQLNHQLDTISRELQRKAGELTEILSINKAVISIVDNLQLLGRLLDGALRIAQADMAWIMLREENTQIYLLKAYRNLPAAWAKKLNQPVDDGLSSLVSHSGQALTIHGIPMEKFKVAGLGKSAAVPPLKVREELQGILIVIRKADLEFDKVVQALLECIASFASISVNQSRLFQAVDVTEQSARVSER